MCWTPVRQSTAVQKGTPIYFRSRPCGRSPVTRMGSASGAELAERACSGTLREGYHPYYNAYGDISGPSVQILRASGAVQLPSSTSTPCFIGCASRLLPRRFSQQLNGLSTSPTALPRELEGVEERTTRGPLTYVMLPLDTVNVDGIFRYAGSSWFSQALQLLVASGAHGVALDFWWGAVERSPGQYNWSGYKQAIEVIKQTGLKVQVVLSFHACGGNVGDTVQILLPEWVLQCGEADPDLFFSDRPRNGSLGNRNREYISIWADDAAGVLRGRSPIQCYEDFMVSLRDNFSQELGTVIDEVVVGAGPCGELRLPAYVEANGWRFPGSGEFQCYDRRALASLAQAAREAGHPEWGYTGPHDAGEYNSIPENTGFFNQNGSWNTPYGRFFLEWYSNSLLRHGERLLTVAHQVFVSGLARSSSLGLQHTHHSSLGGSGGGSGGGGGGFALGQYAGNPPSASQSFQFLHNPANGGRVNGMSLNRILEIGGGGGNVAVQELCGRPPALSVFPQPQPPSASSSSQLQLQQQQQQSRQADGVASISPSCTWSSISTCTTTSSGSSSGAGSRSNVHSALLGGGGGGGGMQSLATQYSLGSGGGGGGMASPRRVAISTLIERESGGSGGGGTSTSTSDLCGVGSGGAVDAVGSVLGCRAGFATPCAGGGGAAAAADVGGMRNASIGSNATGGGLLGGGGAGACGVDTAMVDIEPGDVSNGPIPVGTEIVPAPPASSTNSGSLCQTASALPSPGLSPQAAGRFRSSVPTLGEMGAMYGQATTFSAAAAVAAAAGVIIASGGGPVHMDLCNSLSSLSTEYQTGTGGGGGGGLQTSSTLFMDVAASLVTDGENESDIGTSCGTGVAAEEADDLFALAPTTGGAGTGRAGSPTGRDGELVHAAGAAAAAAAAGSAAPTASAFADAVPSSGSTELGLGLPLGGAMGMGVTDMMAAQPPPPAAAAAAAAAMLIALPPQLASPTTSYFTGPSSGGSAAVTAAGGGGGGLHLALKIAGIHWWYRSRSHAAELTAGYYNVDGRDGYAAIIDLCARYKANLVLTCVEMCDSQHPAQAQCGPEGLLRQLRHLAARAGVSLSGENALPIFSAGGVDVNALDRVVQNMRPCTAPASHGAAAGQRSCTLSPAPTQPPLYQPTTGFAPGGGGGGGNNACMPSLSAPQFQYQQQQPASAFSQLAATAAAITTATAAGNYSGLLSYRVSESGKPIAVINMAAMAPATAVAMQDAQQTWPGYLPWELPPPPLPPSQQQQPTQQQQQQSQQQCLSNGATAAAAVVCPSPESSSAATEVLLPGLRAFTFLRLVPEMLLPGYQKIWMHFMGKMLSLT